MYKRQGHDLPLLKTLGYAEIRQYLTAEITLEEAISLTITHTRQFAKRQRTWFRKNNQIKWFDNSSSDFTEQIWQTVREFQTNFKPNQ